MSPLPSRTFVIRIVYCIEGTRIYRSDVSSHLNDFSTAWLFKKSRWISFHAININLEGWGTLNFYTSRSVSYATEDLLLVEGVQGENSLGRSCPLSLLWAGSMHANPLWFSIPFSECLRLCIGSQWPGLSALCPDSSLRKNPWYPPSKSLIFLKQIGHNPSVLENQPWNFSLYLGRARWPICK